MDSFKKVAGINLLILVIYSIGVHIYATEQVETLILLAVLISIQVGVNFIVSIISFIMKEKKRGIAFIASAGIILVVGFSSCLGGSQFYY